MNYIDTGGSKPILVCVHGLSQTMLSWQYQLELSKCYRLIILELRSHGESTVTENISLHTFAQDIIRLLHKLNIHRASFMGLSLGGIVVQEILKSAPFLVEAIVLSNTTSYIPYSLGMMTVKERERKLSSMSNEEYIRSVIVNCLYDKDNEQLIDEMGEYFFRINDRNAYIEASKAAVGCNYLPTLAFNTKPTLIIGSLNDKVTPYINALTMKFYCPMAQLKLLSGVGHLPCAEKPREFNKIVLKFMNENT